MTKQTKVLVYLLQSYKTAIGTTAERWIPVVESFNEWTAKNARYSFRVWNGRLYRKEIAAYWGDYQIRRVLLSPDNVLLDSKWLEDNGIEVVYDA